MKTFIRWNGNKTKYLKHIVPHLPNDYGTYIEPFVGSGSLFLRVQPHKWIINDLNTDLVNCWHYVMHSPGRIVSHVKKFEKILSVMTLDEKKAFCSRITESIPELQHGFRRSLYFLFIKHVAYMGHIFVRNRFMFPGFTNKPIHLFTDAFTKELYDISKFMKGSDGLIYNDDYKNVLKKAKKGDFVFLDPPYIERHDYQFQYNDGQSNISSSFLTGLKSEAYKLSKRGVMWMMTQANTKDVREAFKEFRMIEYPVYRYQARQWTKELLIMNYYE